MATRQHPWDFARWRIGITVVCFVLCGPVQAQQVPRPPGPPLPRLFTVVPPGGRAGGSVEVTVSGIDLDAPQDLLFSSPGFSTEPIKVPEPKPDPAQVKNQRRAMGGIQGSFLSHRFRVKVPADCAPGFYDVRIVTERGVSNPRTFVVGDHSEALEREPNNDVGEAQRVGLGTTISGVIDTPTDVDYFTFEARAGQRVIVSGLASSIDSRLLLDLELYSAAGRRLASNHEYRGTDALLDVAVPVDGAYVVRACAYTYTRGGNDHFYRITIATPPWVDTIFPPMVEAGKKTEVTVFGRNLPGGKSTPSALESGRLLETLKVTVEPPQDSHALQFHGFLPPLSSCLDGFEYQLKSNEGVSNPFLLGIASAPVVLDTGNNDRPETAQAIAIPTEIAGTIETPNDQDWYTFEAKKGAIIRINAQAERLGSPIDLYVAIRDAQSRRTLVELDDEPLPRNQGQGQAELEARNQFFVRTTDPGPYRFVSPADGRYQLLVSSREAPNLAGPRHVYRVRVAHDQPDFTLVVMPTSTTYPDALVVRRGGACEATVFVWRQDDFNEHIELSADELPAGISCPPQVIGTGQRRGTVVLSAKPDAEPWAGAIRIKGSAVIAGRKLVREARSATITWPVPPQQNIPTISRLDRSLALAVRGDAPFGLEADRNALTLTHGEKGTLTLKLKLTGRDGSVDAKVQTSLLASVPLSVANAVSLSPTKDGARAALNINANVPPGVYSLVFHAQGQVATNLNPAGGQKAGAELTLPSTPVTLTVLPKGRK
jgi:hypothetical protein